VPVIGFLVPGTSSSHGEWITAFVRRLRELGWIEGHNIAIEYRFGEGRNERYIELAAEFVRLKVDLILTAGGEAVAAVKQATSLIPTVFAAAGDPVGGGYVKSLSRPGGNITGLSLQQTDLEGKRLEILREVVPNLHRLAIMANTDNRFAIHEMREVEETARTEGLDISAFKIRRSEDIAPAFEALTGRADALYVCSDPLLLANRTRIITLALTARVPTIYLIRAYVEVGGLVSYGPKFTDLYARPADYVDKILRGAKPGDLPVEQPIKFELVINLTTAKALGLAIPESFLLRADEVIE
jgi:putative ABC transport system substrate-binding protein